MNKKHTEIPIKVNAWVDKDIAPLVLALNEINCIITVDSCQGIGSSPASVFFKYAGNSELSFLHYFAKLLGNEVKCNYELRMSWLTGSTEPIVEIMTDKENINQLASSIKSVMVILRKNRFACDK